MINHWFTRYNVLEPNTHWASELMAPFPTVFAGKVRGFTNDWNKAMTRWRGDGGIVADAGLVDLAKVTDDIYSWLFMNGFLLVWSPDSRRDSLLSVIGTPETLNHPPRIDALLRALPGERNIGLVMRQYRDHNNGGMIEGWDERKRSTKKALLNQMRRGWSKQLTPSFSPGQTEAFIFETSPFQSTPDVPASSFPDTLVNGLSNVVLTY